MSTKDKESRVSCQNTCIPHLAEGRAEVPAESLARRLRLFIRRRLKSGQVREFKSRSSHLLDKLAGLFRRSPGPSPQEPPAAGPKLKAGDLVRVRSKEEIKATLNYWGQLKNCMFMPDMLPYCGTTQRVLKTVERFVDERDYRVKKSRGLVLLEGLTCQGTSDYGRCDRSCFFFWREEWLEKLDELAGNEK